MSTGQAVGQPVHRRPGVPSSWGAARRCDPAGPATTAPDSPAALGRPRQCDRYQRVIQPATTARTSFGASRHRPRGTGRWRTPRERPGSMTTQNGRAFNEWLRAQLKAKKMSQRQLAQQSGRRSLDDLATDPRRPHAVPRARPPSWPAACASCATTPTRRSTWAWSPPGRPIRPPASSTRCAPTSCCPSRRSARSWSTTSPSGCAATAARTPTAASRAGHGRRPARPTERRGRATVRRQRGPWAPAADSTAAPARRDRPRVSTVRSVSRTSGREPGRY